MKREVRNLEFSTMIFVGIEVRSDYDAIVELPAGKSLLRLLAINYAIEFYEYL